MPDPSVQGQVEWHEVPGPNLSLEGWKWVVLPATRIQSQRRRSRRGQYQPLGPNSGMIGAAPALLLPSRPNPNMRGAIKGDIRPPEPNTGVGSWKGVALALWPDPALDRLWMTQLACATNRLSQDSDFQRPHYKKMVVCASGWPYTVRWNR